MDIVKASEEFCQLLSTLVQQVESDKHHVSQSTSLFIKEYSCTVFPPGTAIAVTHFTGPLKKTTVFISKRKCTSPQQQHGDESYELCVSMTESCEETTLLNESVQDETETPSTSRLLVSREYVDIGQSLYNKRVFLTVSQPFYAGQAHSTTHSSVNGFESSLIPLSLDNARYICSLYALGSQRCDSPLPNIWVVCTNERQRIASLGCSFDAQERTLFNYTIYEDDPIVESQMNAKIVPPTTARHGVPAQTHAYSEYVITTSPCTGDNVVPGSVSVQFAWKDPDHLVSTPPESSEAVLRISTSPGYKFSPVLSTFNEVSTLLTLCKIASGQETWHSTESEEIDASDQLVSSNVESFLEEVGSPLSQPLEVTVISPVSGSSVCEPRKDLDFVERLWMFAKHAASLEDLQQTFAAVFKSVLLGQVQPFIHRNSSSILATLLRQMLVCADSAERQLLAPKFQALIAETKILPCLVQLGIDKLKRDYCTFFIGADLATSDQLENFFNTKSSLLNQCLSLCNLHNVAELNASAMSFLDLPTAMLSSLTKTALDVYKDKDFNGFTTTPVFSLPLLAFSVPLKSLISLCTNLKPRLWILSQAAESDGCTVTVYGEQPMFQCSKTSDTTECEDIMYYACRAQCISVNFDYVIQLVCKP